MWFNSNLTSIFILIIVGYVFCLFLGIFIRLAIYRSELKEFLAGNSSDKKHKVERSFEIDKIRSSAKDPVLSSLERRLTAEKMIWKKGKSGYCCFNGIFPFFPIKLIIELDEIDAGTDTFGLKFKFYDRFLNPVMISRVRKSYYEKMKNLYMKLTHKLVEGDVTRVA